MTEILITIPLEEALVEEIRQVSKDLSINVFHAKQGDEVPVDLWEKAEVLYTMYALPDEEQAPDLKWVQFFLAGVDKVVGGSILKRDNIWATTLSGASAPQVAEHILTMMLSLGHNLPDFILRQSRIEWMADKDEKYQPLELCDSTIGVVGYGSVGRQVARLVHGFGATVLGTKRDVMDPEDKGYSIEDKGDPQGDFFTRLYPPQALRSMLAECDYVVVTVPLTPETRGMIGAEQLAALKSSAYLVDASRGGVVDHSALVEALKEKRLAGAALDVFEEEPLPEDHPLWAMPNVIVTPHIASSSAQYQQRANTLFIENLKRFLAGEPLLNQIDLEKGY
ncbi:MAG: D-2-hydroxyacid dehydrogenase [Anaerolineales bacterium]|jgi:phosphoglycerate dehydrogenase-like enzyme